jgi:hypothetical protein
MAHLSELIRGGKGTKRELIACAKVSLIKEFLSAPQMNLKYFTMFTGIATPSYWQS